MMSLRLRRGFTLLELLVVMVIIGLLAAYVGPKYFSQVGKSEVIAVVGPSGSGKSTMIRTLNGLEAVDSGKVEVLGRTAMVFQNFGLFPHMRVLANVTLAPVTRLRVPRAEAEAEADAET